MITMGKTCRNFAIGEFEDFNNVECSIQDSSLATEACIWLGPTAPNPRRMIPGRGWVDAVLPTGVQCTTRMHLNVDQCRELVKVLNRFIETETVSAGK